MATDKARDKVFVAIARGMHRLGIRPNHLTLAQVPVYVLMVDAGLHGRLFAFAMYQALVMALDGMDGTLARRLGLASRSGAILDAAFDVVGIVLVVVVAAHIHPSYAVWLYILLAANLLLYAQNYRLDEKAVSYVRGPVVLGMYLELRWTGILWFAIVVPLAVTAIILLVRAVRSPLPARPDAEGPAPYRPGFSVERRPRA